MAELPSSLHYNVSRVHDMSTEVPHLYAQIMVKLDHLQNIFFIERLLQKAGEMNQADLLTVSVDMVSTTLVLWTNKDRLLGVHGDFEWLV